MKDYSVKIGIFDVAIVHKSLEFFEDLLKDDSEFLLGLYRGNRVNPVIQLWNKLTGRRYVETSIHEIIEAINALNDLGMNHTQISTLSNCLTQVLTDNPKVLSMIKKGSK